MKIISIGSDRKLFDENSEVRQRIIDYGGLVQELHIVVFTKRQSQISNLKSQKLGNAYLYPTNSKSRWFYIFDACRIGKKIIENWKLKIENSLVTAQDPFECGLTGWCLKRKFGLPFQIQIHTDFLSPYFRKESLLNKARAMLAKFLVLRADCIRVVSERVKKSLVVNGYALADKISVLPIFVDVKKIQLESIKIDLRKKYPQFDLIILMASRLTREKNISLAIEAMKEIIKKYPKTGLIIAGDGPERNNLKSQISKLMKIS